MKNLIIMDIYFVILAINFLSSLIVFIKKPAYKFLKLFPAFLFLTIIIEVAGRIISRVEYNQVYNLFNLIEFVFYFFILSRITKSKRLKNILLITIVAYTIIHLINLLFIQGAMYIATYTLNLGALLVVVFSGICIYELFKPVSSISVLSNPAFWICLGLITYYASSFPIWAAVYVMIDIPPQDREPIIIAHLVTNYILYLLFTMSFLCELIFKRKVRNEI